MERNNEKPPARTVMLQGTASDVGKSLLTAALCRIFREDGHAVAPFKSQNMSLNSYVTWDGKEIGRAQGMQADACGILATTDMNPILLKPKKDMVSQVIVHGKPLGDFAARIYRSHVLAEAAPIVREALDALRRRYDVVVLEGAGSPAEINLKDRDIVNMRAAGWADAPVVLVADIDRGGMFASIVGTLELLEPHERDRVCGFIVNKFRGDVSLLRPGLDWLEARTGKPVLGVVPFLPDVGLEDEDSLSLDNALRGRTGAGAALPEGGEQLDIAVLRLPHISNFTDIDPLLAETDVRVRYVASPGQWGQPDAVIVPGSKNTVDDLQFLRVSGLAELLGRHVRSGGHAVGICGGYEMFGERLLDPQRTESDRELTEGFGWFPFDVAFSADKKTVRVEGEALLPGLGRSYPVEGFEIHMGEVSWRPGDGESERKKDGLSHEHGAFQYERGALPGEPVRPFRLRPATVNGSGLRIPGRSDPGGDRTGGDPDRTGNPDGCASADGRVWGTFLHGVLHNDDFRRAWLNGLRRDRGWESLETVRRFKDRRNEAFDRLAAHMRTHVDIARIKRAMRLPDAGSATERVQREEEFR